MIASLALGLVAAAMQLATAPAAEARDELRVVTTIKPVHALVAQLLDGIAEPLVLIDGAQSPHVYALKPSDARTLHRAHMFIRIAPSIEPFSEKLRTALPDTVDVVTLIDVPGLVKLPARDAGAFEAHDHGDHDHSGHEHGHGDDDHDSHSKGSDVTYDPHVWLDPENAAAIVRALAEKFAQRAPELADKIEANKSAALARLTKLDTDLKSQLADVKDVPFVVFHDAFHYFESHYGLSAVGAITLHPEAPPSAKRLQAIRAKIKSAQAQCVFSEPQFSARRIANVIEGSGARPGVLDPLGGDVPKGKDAYDTMMRNLARAAAACLKN